MMNRILLMGRLVADPELRTTPNGVSVATFRIAVERNYQTKEQERQADFISCVAWRQTGEFITGHFGKGGMIGVDGALQTRSYQDRDGNKRTAVEVNVEHAYFCGNSLPQPETDGSRQQAGGNRQQAGRNGAGKQPTQAFGAFADYMGDDGDDLPF